jgi:hypothetical protein
LYRNFVVLNWSSVSRGPLTHLTTGFLFNQPVDSLPPTLTHLTTGLTSQKTPTSPHHCYFNININFSLSFSFLSITFHPLSPSTYPPLSSPLLPPCMEVDMPSVTMNCFKVFYLFLYFLPFYPFLLIGTKLLVHFYQMLFILFALFVC